MELKEIIGLAAYAVSHGTYRRRISTGRTYVPNADTPVAMRAASEFWWEKELELKRKNATAKAELRRRKGAGEPPEGLRKVGGYLSAEFESLPENERRALL